MTEVAKYEKEDEEDIQAIKAKERAKLQVTAKFDINKPETWIYCVFIDINTKELIQVINYDPKIKPNLTIIGAFETQGGGSADVRDFLWSHRPATKKEYMDAVRARQARGICPECNGTKEVWNHLDPSQMMPCPGCQEDENGDPISVAQSPDIRVQHEEHGDKSVSKISQRPEAMDFKGFSDIELAKLAHDLRRFPEDKVHLNACMEEIKRRQTAIEVPQSATLKTLTLKAGPTTDKTGSIKVLLDTDGKVEEAITKQLSEPEQTLLHRLRQSDNEHVSWLKKNGKACSPLGERVASMLGFMFDGLHHIPKEVLHERTHWSDANCIEVVLYHNLATFDGDLLTELVVLSHDECVRVEVNAKAPNYVQLLFSPRVRDDGKNHLFERMPTMEEHMAKIRKNYGTVEP